MKWKLELQKLSFLGCLYLFLFCVHAFSGWAINALLLSVSPLWLWEHGLSDTVSSSINKRHSRSHDQPFPSLIRSWRSICEALSMLKGNTSRVIHSLCYRVEGTPTRQNGRVELAKASNPTKQCRRINPDYLPMLFSENKWKISGPD